MKLTVGSVQLGMKYGIFENKRVNKTEFKKIEKLVLLSKIDSIDTSTNYGFSEKIIGNSKLNKLKIISKIKLPASYKVKKKDIQKFVSLEIESSLKKLKTNSLYGLLVHDQKNLLGERGKIFLSSLKELKKKKIVKKIGLSIYSPSELRKIWKFWKPEIVQAPFNILDQRLEKSGWLNILKKYRVKVFARSCFLQGLLIGNQDSLNIHSSHKLILNKFNNWCKFKKISRLKACLHFVKQFKKIDYLIVGFDNYIQLKEIFDTFDKKITIAIPKFSTNRLSLIDPRKWKKKQIKL